MTKYFINITTEDGELLNRMAIETFEMNWDTANSKREITMEIFDEIYRDIRRREDG